MLKITPPPKRVLGVSAHPDDLEWYAGGTLAKLANAGCEMTFVICTEGDKGSYDPEAQPSALAAQRKREQEAAAELLGRVKLVYLGYPDGELRVTRGLLERLSGLYRQHRPDLLLCFDPWKRYELHPDHLAAGRAAVEARIGARMPLYYPEQRRSGKLDAWAVREMWLFNPDAPNYWEDIGATFETKLRMLALHASQSVSDAASRAFLEQEARATGAQVRVEFAEAFRRIVIQGALVTAGGTRTEDSERVTGS